MAAQNFDTPKLFFSMYSKSNMLFFQFPKVLALWHKNQAKYSRFKFWSVNSSSVFYALLNLQYLCNRLCWRVEILDLQSLKIILKEILLFNDFQNPHDPTFSDS